MTEKAVAEARINAILAVLDPSVEKQAALERALALAKCFDCPLEAFVSIYDQYLAGMRFADSPGLERARKALKASSEEWVRSRLKTLDVRGVQLSVHVAWGPPCAETILDRARTSGADLIVKEARYHPRLERALFNNTDWNLLRGFESALWLVQPGDWPHSPVILAAVDPSQEHSKPSDLDARILELAGSMAQVLKGQLHVVHAYPLISNSILTIVAIPGAVPYPLEVSGEDVEARYRDELEDLLAGRQIGETNIHFLPGDPRDVLLERSKSLGANLMVMGVVARGPIKRMMLGSTAEQVLDALRCDVLAVRVA
ncbi:MAG: universal stress protein [Gammaproteobacteria bacterium]|nr:universal stress protein [Gammaproteobacteria bacterium]